MRKRLAQNKQSVAAAIKANPASLVVIAGVFAIAGILFLLSTSAAVVNRGFEAENGTLANVPVPTVNTGSNASGGKFVTLNQSIGGGNVLGLDEWTYIHADSSRAGPAHLWGLGLGDVTGDGYADIVAGQYIYINKGTGDITGTWTRKQVFNDAQAVVYLNGNDVPYVADFLGELRILRWTGGADGSPGVFASGSGPSAHQGLAQGDVVAGNSTQEIVYSTDNAVYVAVVNGSSITATELASGMADEGVAVGDINGDGKNDVVGSDGNNAVWLENNGTDSGWTKHIVGPADNGESGGGYTDKVAIADIDKDGKMDVLLSEEVFDGGPANTYWWKNPGAAGVNSQWPQRTIIASQDTTNSMSVADMDGDGDTDVITGEHRGDMEAVVWENNGTGLQWTKHVASTGHENHGGTKVIDLDNDGDLDIVSIGYDAPQDLHIYRNDAITN